MTPLLGTVVFVILYVVATFYYPGGSQSDPDSDGFSWIDNYWCNLLNDTAINGQKNSAKPVAIVSMMFLCLSLAGFWLQYPNYTSLNMITRRMIQVCGTLAMATGFLLLTSIDHDLVTNLASLFGLVAATGTIVGLYRNCWKLLFYFGLFNIVLVVINNILYYNRDYISYLPLVQKITFAAFLTWICCIVLKMYKIAGAKESRNARSWI